MHLTLRPVVAKWPTLERLVFVGAGNILPQRLRLPAASSVQLAKVWIWDITGYKAYA
jgi:hypothetical protein